MPGLMDQRHPMGLVIDHEAFALKPVAEMLLNDREHVVAGFNHRRHDRTVNGKPHKAEKEMPFPPQMLYRLL
ncbi:hypothetical protein D3C75_1288500 [compost metagenome]